MAKNHLNNYKSLISEINKKKIKIGVVGLGYVGLPLAVEKAKAGYKVIWTLLCSYKTCFFPDNASVKDINS